MPVCRIAVNTFCELMGAEIACDEPSVVEYVTRFMRVPGAAVTTTIWTIDLVSNFSGSATQIKHACQEIL